MSKPKKRVLIVGTLAWPFVGGQHWTQYHLIDNVPVVPPVLAPAGTPVRKTRGKGPTHYLIHHKGVKYEIPACFVSEAG